MHNRTIPSLIVSFFCLVQGASADTIVLNNGEKIEGRIVREDGDNYVVEVRVSGTIKDERVIPKNEVKLIEEEKEDQKAFRMIADLVPTPEMLSEEDYEVRIEKVREFTEKFPASERTPRAKEMLDILNEEFEVIRDGGIKFEDEMVSEETYNLNAYEFDSTIAEKSIDESINRRDFLRALRLFTDYEKTFSDAAGRDDIAGRIHQVLNAYGTRIDESLVSFDLRIEKRQAGLGSMAADDRAQAERAIANEMQLLEERFQKEKEEQLSWITPYPYHKQSLEEARRQVDREISRLKSKSRNQPLDTPLEEVYRVTWTKLSSGDQQEKKVVLDEVKGLGMPDIYLDKLRRHAEIE